MPESMQNDWRLAALECFPDINQGIFQKLTEEGDDYPIILDTIAGLVAAFSCHTPG
jgi:hypothetical protein